MAYLLDENVTPRAAELARDRDLDVLSLVETGRIGLPARERLALAAEAGWVFVTRNREDYLLLTRSLFRTGEPHHGLLLVDAALAPGDAAGIADALAAREAGTGGGRLRSYAVAYLRPAGAGAG